MKAGNPGLDDQLDPAVAARQKVMLNHHNGAPLSAAMDPAALPSIQEHRASCIAINPPGARPMTASRPFGTVMVAGREPPWQSPAVMSLASRVGGSDVHATPMLVEGQAGTVLAAVGNARDHQVATAAISRSLNNQLEGKLLRAEMYKEELSARVRAAEKATTERPPPVPPKLRLASTTAPSPSAGQPLAVRRNTHASLAGTDDAIMCRRGASGCGMSFGAVYEYRDEFGRPRWVGSTADKPEAAMKRDFDGTREVRSLAGAGGSADVVWAGVGRAPCVGPQEMQAAREAIARDRSERQRIGELRGSKPYSRHSHLVMSCD